MLKDNKFIKNCIEEMNLIVEDKKEIVEVVDKLESCLEEEIKENLNMVVEYVGEVIFLGEFEEYINCNKEEIKKDYESYREFEESLEK